MVNYLKWPQSRPSTCPGQFNGCKVQRRNSPTSPHAHNWPTEGVIPTGLPNRRTWIPLNTYGMSWINVCASDNLHLGPSINSAKCCNRNGEQYQETMRKLNESIARGCWPHVVVMHGTSFNVTGSVLNCDKLSFFCLSSEVWTVNFSIINILSRYLKV